MTTFCLAQKERLWKRSEEKMNQNVCHYVPGSKSLMCINWLLIMSLKKHIHKLWFKIN